MRYVDWHPSACLLASASKDALVKLWDPRQPGEALASLHGHKSGLTQVCGLWVGWGKAERGERRLPTHVCLHCLYTGVKGEGHQVHGSEMSGKQQRACGRT